MLYPVLIQTPVYLELLQHALAKSSTVLAYTTLTAKLYFRICPVWTAVCLV